MSRIHRIVIFLYLLLGLSNQCLTQTNKTSCTTPNGETGLCTSLYNCDQYLNLLCTRNSTVVEYIRQSHCGFDGDPLVCCANVQNLDSIPKPNAIESKMKTSLLPSRRICGYQHTDDRFYYEEATAIDEFPWLALVKFHEAYDVLPMYYDVFTCTGVLINRRYVLTTATCLLKKTYLPGFRSNVTVQEVSFGVYSINTNGTDCTENPAYPECTEPIVNVGAEKVIIHPKFNGSRTLSQNDIALIRLVRSLKLTEYIRPICLPMKDDIKVSVGDSLSTSYFQYLPSVTDKIAVKPRGNLTVADNEIICDGEADDATQFCAHFDEANCVTINGAAVMHRLNFQWRLEGLLSVAYGRYPKKDPHTCYGYVMKISAYADWITDNLVT